MIIGWTVRAVGFRERRFGPVTSETGFWEGSRIYRGVINRTGEHFAARPVADWS